MGRHGPYDEISKIMKQLDKNGIEALTNLFNNVCETGVTSTEWLKSTVFAIQKKTRAKKCSDYKKIGLMSNVLKIFLRIIHGRIYKTNWTSRLATLSLYFGMSWVQKMLYLKFKY